MFNLLNLHFSRLKCKFQVTCKYTYILPFVHVVRLLSLYSWLEAFSQVVVYYANIVEAEKCWPDSVHNEYCEEEEEEAIACHCHCYGAGDDQGPTGKPICFKYRDWI